MASNCVFCVAVTSSRRVLRRRVELGVFCVSVSVPRCVRGDRPFSRCVAHVLSLPWQTETTGSTSKAGVAQLCRWCYLPAATHGGVNKCPSRQYPSVKMCAAAERANAAGSKAKSSKPYSAYRKLWHAQERSLEREADAKLALLKRQGKLPAVPSGASLKEEVAARPMPPGTSVKEEGVPPMPPDAFVKVEVVVKEEEE